MRKVLAAVFWIGLFVLMLSALVVSPQEEAASQRPLPPAHYHAVFMPRTEPAAPQSTAPARQESGMKMAAVLMLASAMLPCLPRQRDANGRIIRAKRYAASVYQVFRLEMAYG